MRYLFGRFTTSLFVLGGLVLVVVSPAHAKTYTVTVSKTSDGPTEQSIGATEGCTRFDIQDLVEAGLGHYRFWAGMSRLEPVDDNGSYGTPTIDQIKAITDPQAIDTQTFFNWPAWDFQFQRPDAYHFSPTCVSGRSEQSPRYADGSLRP